MILTRKWFHVTLTALILTAPGLTLAADSSMSSSSETTTSESPNLKQLETKVKGACQSDIKKYCSDVQAGQGRIASCLDSQQDHLSTDCHNTWRDAKAEVSHRMDKAEVAFRKNCGTDVQKFCTNVPSGQGRILDCLSKHKDSLSNSCTAFEAKLDQKLSEFMG